MSIDEKEARDRMLGEAAVLNRFVSRDELESCLALRCATQPSRDLGDILVARGLLTRERLAKLRHAVDVAWSRQHAPPSDPLLGATLGGNFRILRLLGVGGMGSVYLARQLSLDRLVAVKLLHPAETLSREVVERFRREAQAAARLTHAAVVRVYAFEQDEGRSFLAMEYVEGETLADRFARSRPLPHEEALRIARDVAAGLAAAHAQGIVHRDVKPQNVFLAKEGGVKLGDFGLARDMSADGLVSVAGQILGTALYMAPEQCQGLKVDPRADLYALGAMLFHVVTGRPPFRGATVVELLHQHITVPAPAARSILPDLPLPIDELLARLLAKDPDQRPPSAAYTVLCLQAALEGRGAPPAPVARPAPPPEPRPVGETDAEAATRPAIPPPRTTSGRDRARTMAARRYRKLLVAALLTAVLVGALLFCLLELAPERTMAGAGTAPGIVPARTQAPPRPPAEPPPALRPTAGPPQKAAVPLDIDLGGVAGGTPGPSAPDAAHQELDPFARARQALGEARFDDALALVEAARTTFQDAQSAEAWQEFRAEISRALLARLSTATEKVRELLGRADFAAAEAELVNLEREVGMAGAPAVAALKDSLRQGQAAAREQADAEAEALWRELATEAWKQAVERKWTAASELCRQGLDRPALAPRRARMEALGRVVDLGRRAHEAVPAGLLRLAKTRVSFDKAHGGSLEGELLPGAPAGSVRVGVDGTKGGFAGCALAELAPSAWLLLAREGLGDDPQASAAIALLALSLGVEADAGLLLSADRSGLDELASVFEEAGAGWDAPWSTVAIERRLREAAKAPPGAPPVAAPEPGAQGEPRAGGEPEKPGREAGRRLPPFSPIVVRLPKGLALDLIVLPEGAFALGSAEVEAGRAGNEGPVRTVQVASFAMGRYEVTQEQFEAVMGTNPSKHAGERLPVESVTWKEAAQFCARLTSPGRGRFRLPTEAEWEYACRAGTSSAYFFGDAAHLPSYAWCEANSEGKLRRIGLKKPNPWGLYDLAGNAWELCSTLDWDYPYDAADGREDAAADGGRIVRGGSAFDGPEHCRSARRDDIPPDRRAPEVGFRVAFDPPPR
ncbi:MAG: SUMF1/EgtB/PvdO family nonheme iron enzyme [Planctomycetes bacterium]|nr:SUMF1/EgtB/PvdO family nonheme iron enzyme [Planctomycetota bacterium]